MSQGRYASALYTPSEGALTLRGRLSSAGRAERLLLATHGAGLDATMYAQSGSSGSLANLLAPIVHTGRYGVLAIDAGGTQTWGNQSTIDAITAAIAWARGASGFASQSAKVGLLGYSMGGCGALNYLQRNPANVAGFVGFAPACDLDAMHADARFTANIDTAYGGSYAANSVGHNPQAFAAGLTTPTRLYSAVDDSQVANSQVHAFYNALTVSNKAMVDLPGGDHYTFPQYIDNRDVTAWLEGLSW